jgi:hypothetical protein
MKICDACRKQTKVKKVTKEQDCSVPVAATTNTAGPSRKDEEFVDLDVSLEYLNKFLVTLEVSPVAKKRLHAPSYCDKNLRKITFMEEKIFTDSAMLNQLKKSLKGRT